MLVRRCNEPNAFVTHARRRTCCYNITSIYPCKDYVRTRDFDALSQKCCYLPLLAGCLCDYLLLTTLASPIGCARHATLRCSTLRYAALRYTSLHYITHNLCCTSLLCSIPLYATLHDNQAGYVGEDVESILHKLYMESGQDIERCQRGIVYLDEIDKVRAGVYLS